MAGFYSSQLALRAGSTSAILCFLPPESSQAVVLLCPRGHVAISGGILVSCPSMVVCYWHLVGSGQGQNRTQLQEEPSGPK